MVMVHRDNLVLPRVASVQVVVVPCGITAKMNDADRNKINDACNGIARFLIDVGVCAKVDLQDEYTPGYKLTTGNKRIDPGCFLFRRT